MISAPNLEALTRIKIFILTKELLSLASTLWKLRRNIKKKLLKKRDFVKDTIVSILEIF